MAKKDPSTSKTENKKKVEKKIKEVELVEPKIKLNAYFVRANIKRHEWLPRKVYASKHIPSLEATLKEWNNLFKKY